MKKTFEFIIKEIQEQDCSVEAESYKSACFLIGKTIEELEKTKTDSKFQIYYKDTKQIILNILNEQLFAEEEQFSSYEEFDDFLHNTFNNFLAETVDPELAFQQLNNQLKGFLSKYFILTTEPFNWEVNLLPDFSAVVLLNACDIFKVLRPSELISILSSKIDNKVQHNIPPVDALNIISSELDFDFTKCVSVHCDPIIHRIEPLNLEVAIDLPF